MKKIATSDIYSIALQLILGAGKSVELMGCL